MPNGKKNNCYPILLVIRIFSVCKVVLRLVVRTILLLANEPIELIFLIYTQQTIRYEKKTSNGHDARHSYGRGMLKG